MNLPIQLPKSHSWYHLLLFLQWVDETQDKYLLHKYLSFSLPSLHFCRHCLNASLFPWIIARTSLLLFYLDLSHSPSFYTASGIIFLKCKYAFHPWTVFQRFSNACRVKPATLGSFRGYFIIWAIPNFYASPLAIFPLVPLHPTLLCFSKLSNYIIFSHEFLKKNCSPIISIT